MHIIGSFHYFSRYRFITLNWCPIINSSQRNNAASVVNYDLDEQLEAHLDVEMAYAVRNFKIYYLPNFASSSIFSAT